MEEGTRAGARDSQLSGQFASIKPNAAGLPSQSDRGCYHISRMHSKSGPGAADATANRQFSPRSLGSPSNDHLLLFSQASQLRPNDPFRFVRDCSPATTVCLAGHYAQRNCLFKIFAISSRTLLFFARGARVFILHTAPSSLAFVCWLRSRFSLAFDLYSLPLLGIQDVQGGPLEKSNLLGC